MIWISIVCFILISSGLFWIFDIPTLSLFKVFVPKKVTPLNDALQIIQGIPPKGFFTQSYEIKQLLKMTSREDKYILIKRMSFLMFAVGAVFALLLGNLYLMPALGFGFAMLPIWYLRSTAAIYKKHLNEELETAVSIVTTSYLRTENIIQAVKENINYINPPAKAAFEAFLYESQMINANIVAALNSLKMSIPNRIFCEWCDTLIQCQSDRLMKSTIPTTIQKFSDIRIVQAELDSIMAEPKREAITMMFLVLFNIPLLYILNKDWFYALMYSTPGKIALAICAAIILFACSKIQSLSKPIEYKG